MFSSEKAAKATEEYTQQLGDIYKHECYGQRKKECKFNADLAYILCNLITVKSDVLLLGSLQCCGATLTDSLLDATCVFQFKFARASCQVPVFIFSV